MDGQGPLAQILTHKHSPRTTSSHYACRDPRAYTAQLQSRVSLAPWWWLARKARGYLSMAQHAHGTYRAIPCSQGLPNKRLCLLPVGSRKVYERWKDEQSSGRGAQVGRGYEQGEWGSKWVV